MDYSFLVGVHHKELGDCIDMDYLPQKQQQQQQQQQQSSAEDEVALDGRGRRLSPLRRDDGGVQGMDHNEVRDV
jgi:hypothetical protein